MRATITHSAIAVPGHELPQDKVTRALAGLLPFAPERLAAVMAVFDNAAVTRRFSALPLEQLCVRRGLSETMAIYRDEAVRLGQRVAEECLARASLPAHDVDLIIAVSCTGFMLPSLDAYLANAMGMRRDVRRLPITELGCVAGAAALARAHDFLTGHPHGKVLIVSVELPTLSFQQTDASWANLVSTALFGDGAAAVLVTGGDAPIGAGIVDVQSHLFPNTLDTLGFDLRDDGFHVVLAKELPALLRAQLADVVDGFLARTGVRRDQLSSALLHPGGRKILNAVEEGLGIERARTQPSWDVLRDYGNMSSASILFVLHNWLHQQHPAAGSHGLVAGLGPGLTAELLLLRWN